ncbi:uncharacterized protein C8R40DRAFT_1172941 [Lentinula edodes]|uniref:uncharacterized protein n=1 Tax=Lentinula edodes TaxID=5353 RepID=UPI001E8E0390|nr:uncharacterized protein C8R40DRAFT_1172941 [Lentinula edodes]KAH7872884.1 hypothetical protein C8R40DRAFT_1172941 [Lentinula edodes]
MFMPHLVSSTALYLSPPSVLSKCLKAFPVGPSLFPLPFLLASFLCLHLQLSLSPALTPTLTPVLDLRPTSPPPPCLCFPHLLTPPPSSPPPPPLLTVGRATLIIMVIVPVLIYHLKKRARQWSSEALSGSPDGSSDHNRLRMTQSVVGKIGGNHDLTAGETGAAAQCAVLVPF